MAAAASERLDGLGPELLRASLRELHALETMVAAEKLRRVAALDAVRADLGAFRDTEGAVANELGLTRGEAKRLTRTAAALERLPRVAEKLAEGSLGLGQAEEAARAIEAMDDAVAVADDPAAARRQASETAAEIDELVASGQSGDRHHTRRAVDRVVGSRSQVLADRERRAWAGRRFSLGRSADGGWACEGRLDVLGGAHLVAALDALSRPAGAGDDRNPEQRRADALVELARRGLDGGELPQVAAQRPHVILVTTPDAQHDLPDAAPAELDGYGAVSADLARQICCDADLTPVAVEGQGRPLDAGRARRLPSSRQRAAVIARDGACVGCAAPASRCQVHHIRWWRNGGATDVSNLCLLCWNCHHHVHQQGWTVWQEPDHRWRAGPPRPHRRTA